MEVSKFCPKNMRYHTSANSFLPWIVFPLQCFRSNYRISANSFHGEYSFLKVDIQRSQYMRPKVTLHKCAKIFKGGKYSREKTICGNMVFNLWKIAIMRKLYENFHICHFQKRIVSEETICGNTVFYCLEMWKQVHSWRMFFFDLPRR